MILEVNDRHLPNQGVLGGGAILMTPPIDEDYWYYRVQLSEKQAIVGFPKFSTIGIGFAKEEDWNTNLPFTVSAERIYDHIKHNKGDRSIKKAACLEAIELIREAARRFKGMDDEEWASEQARMADH